MLSVPRIVLMCLMLVLMRGVSFAFERGTRSDRRRSRDYCGSEIRGHQHQRE
jgi:hypothetical protein